MITLYSYVYAETKANRRTDARRICYQEGEVEEDADKLVVQRWLINKWLDRGD